MSTRPSTRRHVPATWPSTRNLGFDCRIDVAILLPYQDGAARVHEEQRFPRRQEADGRIDARCGERLSRQVDQPFAVLGAEGAQPEVRERRVDLGTAHARPQ